MKALLDRIQELQQRRSTLEPSRDERDLLLDRATEFTNWFYCGLNGRKAFAHNSKIDQDLGLTSEPRSFKELLEVYKNQVVEPGIQAASGSHLGYVPGGGIFASSIGDMLADVSNEYAGIFYASPGAVTMEQELINWLKGLFTYPSTAAGNLTSGGSIANLIALTAARDKHGIKGSKIESSVVYLGKQTHHCVLKALRIIGLEDIAIREIDLDEGSRIRPGDLEEKIRIDLEKGLEPFLVIASAGTTDTGAIDPLLAIGEISREFNLWYHIDAAYGGFFMLTESRKKALKGIELSDSLVVDPHKGLFLPYGIGAVLVKDKQAVHHSHLYTASYMQDATGESFPDNPADLSPELTRHFRGMRMWLPLSLYGPEPFAACLEEKLLLTRYFRQEIKKMGFRTGPEPDLSISYFWREEPGFDQRELNKKLLEFMHRDGTAYFSSTNIGEKFVIRIAILSFRTGIEQVDRALEMIKKCLDQTLAHFKTSRHKSTDQQ